MTALQRVQDPGRARQPAAAGLTTGFFSILGPGKRLPPHYGPYRSPYIPAARAQHVHREAEFTATWDATRGRT